MSLPVEGDQLSVSGLIRESLSRKMVPKKKKKIDLYNTLETKCRF